MSFQRQWPVNSADCAQIFNLGERILRKSLRRPNLKVNFKVEAVWALYPDTLTQIKSKHNPQSLQAIAS